MTSAAIAAVLEGLVERKTIEVGQARGLSAENIGIIDQEACFNLVKLTGRLLGLMRTEAPDAIFVNTYEGGRACFCPASSLPQCRTG
jgi:hypothetical protein